MSTKNEQRAAQLAKLLDTGKADSQRRFTPVPIATADPAEAIPAPSVPAVEQKTEKAHRATQTIEIPQEDITGMGLEAFGASTKTVSTRLPERLHHTVRVFCVENGNDQQGFFGQAVLAYLQLQAKLGKKVRLQ